MRYHKLIFSSLFILIAFAINAQKKGDVITFQYNGQVFELAKGNKIQLGKGSNSDGSFASIERDKVIKKRERYSSDRGRGGSSKNTDVYTGEKEYLRPYYTNNSISIQKVKYYKKMDQYHLYVFTTDGAFTFHLEEAINRGEVIAINGVGLGNANTISQTENSRGVAGAATKASNRGLNYILYLKNGSEIKCNVLEMVPNDYVKIETFDRSTFVFSMDEVKELKEIENKPLDNNNTTVTSTTTNSFLIQTLSVQRDTTPIGSFYNTTELSYYIPNSIYAQTGYLRDHEVIIGVNRGISVRNISGYIFKDYLFLGGGPGYIAHTAKYKENYHALYFGFNQRLFVLGKKRISPTVSLHQNFGSIVSGISFNEGSFMEYIFNFGTRFTLGKNLYLTTTLGYAIQYFDADIVKNGRLLEDQNTIANYFSINLAFGFKK